jgi:hypothetical protein
MFKEYYRKHGHSRFHLPGKKTWLKEEYYFEVVLIDATESPVERPKYHVH